MQDLPDREVSERVDELLNWVLMEKALLRPGADSCNFW